MSRLLITGGTGFVGAAVARGALARGHEVHVLARGPAAVPAGAVFHAHDLLSEAPVDLLRDLGATHLLHLAWIATPGQYWTSPENTAWATSSLTLLKAFADAGGERAVVAGSCAEYDWSTGGVLTEGATPLRPGTPYGRAKLDLHRAAEPLTRDGLDLAWARLFFLYGPGEHPDRLVPFIVRHLLRQQPAACTAGTQIRDFLHVTDAAEALLELAESATTGAVNVASGDGTPVKVVAEELGRLVGRPDLLRLGARPTSATEPPVLVADIARLRDDVGWSPRMTLTEGLAQTVSWWREQRERE